MMKKLYNIILSSFLARYIFLLTLIISIWTLFGDLHGISYKSLRFFISIGCILLIPLLLNILFTALEHMIFNGSNARDDILKLLNHKTGVEVSMRILDKKTEMDTLHTYELLFRQDLLNYDTEDFCSYRRITGFNSSKRISEELVYVESCDYAVKYCDIEIIAIDTKTQKHLVVDCEYPTNERRIQHVFRIHFLQALNPEDDFDISFFIKIPRELSILDKDKEFNGISLVRIKNPVRKLVYNMCLSFCPRAYSAFARRYNDTFGVNEIYEIPGAVLEAYEPKSDLDKKFDIDWTDNTPYIIRFETDNPEFQQYLLRYIR